MILNEKALNLYAKNGINVLLSGRHGVGKTEIIKSVFNSVFGENSPEKEKWVYFSASTMDPWVDFIGVPKAVKDASGNDVLELIRPARFHNDDVEAIFFDEFNRAPAKVRNAVMELIQFKSINGRKFKNLKVIWAAVNPFDEEGTYDVEQIDPAQLDRFEIQIAVPYKVDNSYMKKAHGAIATPFYEWWTALNADLKNKISPRRLDKAAHIYKIGGDLKDVLPVQANVADLLERIKKLSLNDEWDTFKAMSDIEKELFLSNVNNAQKFESKILNDFSSNVKYVSEDFLCTKVETRIQPWVEACINNLDSLSNSFISTLEKKHKNKIEDVLSSFLDKVTTSAPSSLKGKNVVITGKFKLNYAIGGNSRSSIEQILNKVGAFVQDKISGSTDFLITPDPNSGSSKNQSAKSFGTTIMSEAEFHSLYGKIK